MTYTGRYQVKLVRSPLTGRRVVVVLDPGGEYLCCGVLRSLADAHAAIARDIRARRAAHSGLAHDLVYTPNV